MLRQFILSQMAFHARSLEVLTEANEHIDTMGPERDIQVRSSHVGMHWSTHIRV